MARSGYGIVLFFIVIASFVGFNRKAMLGYVIISITGIVLALTLENLGPLARLKNLWDYVELTNLHSIRTADFNVYIRIAPILYYFETHSWIDLQFYLGHG